MAAQRRRLSTDDPGNALADALEVAGLPPDRAARLEQMRYEIVAARPGQWLREPGAPRPEVILVRSGLLAKQKMVSNGTQPIVALRFPGEAILPRIGPALHGIQALAASEVFVADGRELMMIANADPVLVNILWAVIQRNEAIAHEWLVNHARRDGAARVVHLLLETCVRSGIRIGPQPFRNPFKHEQIAQITGQTAVNVSKVFADLARLDLIERDGRELRFKKLDELFRIADFDPTYLLFPA